MEKNNRHTALQVFAFIAFALQPIILPSQMPDAGNALQSPMTLVNVLSNVLLFGFF
jgi:hypothetical protein